MVDKYSIMSLERLAQHRVHFCVCFWVEQESSLVMTYFKNLRLKCKVCRNTKFKIEKLLTTTPGGNNTCEFY